jgi:hypothetical protein
MDAVDSISRATVRSTSVICDQIIVLNGFCMKQDYLEHLCRIRVKDAESDKTQSDDLADADHLRALQKPLAGKSVPQVDQTASSDQTVEQAHAKAPA